MSGQKSCTHSFPHSYIVLYVIELVPVPNIAEILLAWRWAIINQDTRLCDKVGQWLTADRWFSPGTPDSSINKIDRNDIAEILLNHNPYASKICYNHPSLCNMCTIIANDWLIDWLMIAQRQASSISAIIGTGTSSMTYKTI
jgi:hypothetical protein